MRLERLTIEVKFARGESGVIAGYASLFGRPADHVDDVVMPGAYRATLAAHKRAGTMPEMLHEHGGEPIGEWLEMEEDELGLRVKGRLDLDTEGGRATYQALVAGEIDALSIGYVAVKSGRDRDGARLLHQIDLHEVSLVKRPAASRARVLSVKHKGTNMKPKTKAEGEAPEETDERTLEDRVGALETDVAAIKTDVAKLAGATEEASKSLGRIEVKMNRPGGGPVDPKEAAKAERKALAALLRTGSYVAIQEAGGALESKAASSDSDPAGGYFVLPTIDMSIRTLMTDLSPLRGLAEVVTISTDRYERFYSIGARGAQWVSERDARPQDTARPELKKLSLGVSELYAAPAATQHLLDDAAADIASWLVNNATHDFAETEGEAFLRGDGVEGKPRGLLDYGTTNEKDFVRSWGQHQYIPAGHASAPTDANLVTACIKIVAALRKPYKGNAKWLMNSNTATRLQAIVDENGRRLWAPTGNLIEGVEHPLLGYAVEIDEGMDDIGAGNHPIAFGDFQQGYVIVDRQGVRINRDEVTQKGRVLFDTYKRVGGGAGDFNAIKFIKVAAS